VCGGFHGPSAARSQPCRRQRRAPLDLSRAGGCQGDIRALGGASCPAPKWARQVGNDGVARVLVPLEEARKPARNGTRDLAAGQSPDIRTVPPDVTPDILPAIREVIREVVVPLTEQLERERNRADRAEQRIGDLEAELASERGLRVDAIGAERIAAGEAAALRAELDALRKRRRRWFRW